MKLTEKNIIIILFAIVFIMGIYISFTAGNRIKETQINGIIQNNIQLNNLKLNTEQFLTRQPLQVRKIFSQLGYSVSLDTVSM